MRAVYFEELADDHDKQARTWKSCHNEKYFIGTVRACFKGTPRRAKKPRSEAAVNREMAWLRAILVRYSRTMLLGGSSQQLIPITRSAL
jgi:hypothetical protein